MKDDYKKSFSEKYPKKENQKNDEQKDLSSKIVMLKQKLTENGNFQTVLNRFFESVQKFKTFGIITTLTVEMIDSLIERIEVCETKKVDGKRQQQVNIYLRGIGLFDTKILR